MIFPYRQVTQKIRRPVIPVILKNKSKFVLYSGLIDSGADYCIFNIQLAKELDIPLQPKKIILKGIGREKVTGYLAEGEISIDGSSYDLTAIFAEMEEFGHGILGQQGFFEHFDVRLSYRNRQIEIDSISTES